jgi:glycosyltransferase involved in cell wall biosynthesis
LRDLVNAGVEVVLIDHNSNDGTRELAEQFLGHGLLYIRDLDWEGSFSLTKQLAAKQDVLSRSNHDWIIHCDADEWLVTGERSQSLLEGLEAAHVSGANIVNFREIVFIPNLEKDHNLDEYPQEMLDYYLFEPFYPRLNRAWRRDARLNNLDSGGHLLCGNGRILYSKDFILRHYIAISTSQFQHKYRDRFFSQEDISKGWHTNRINIPVDKFSLKQIPQIKRLSHFDSCEFDLSEPLSRHFWEW